MILQNLRLNSPVLILQHDKIRTFRSENISFPCRCLWFPGRVSSLVAVAKIRVPRQGVVSRLSDDEMLLPHLQNHLRLHPHSSAKEIKTT